MLHEIYITLILSAVNLHICTCIAIDLSNYDETCLQHIMDRNFLNESVAIVGKKFQKAHFPETAPYIVYRDYIWDDLEIRNFFIYLDDFPNATILFQKMNSQGKYVIVVSADEDPQNIRNIFNLAHLNRIINLVAIERSAKSSKLYLREDRNFCDNSSTLKVTERNCEMHIKVFETHTNFGGKCGIKIAHLVNPPFVINITAEKNPGLMVSMLNVIEEISGLEMDYRLNCSHFEHEMLTNGSLHQLTEELATGKFDLAIGRLIMNDTVTAPFQLGPLLHNDDLRFTAPKPKKLKSYRKLFLVFKLDLWGKLFVAVLVIISLYYVIGLCESFHQTAFFSVMFDIFRVSIGSGVNVLPQKSSLRVLLVFYSLFAMNIDSVYLGKLSSVFASNNYDISVKNLEAANARQMVFEVSWQVERLYLLKYVTRNVKAGKRKRLYIGNGTQDYYLQYTALGKENGTVLFTSLIDSHPSEAALLDNFHVMTAYMTFFITFYLRRNAPFNDAIMFWASEIIEKGFLVKWSNDIKIGNIRREILPKDEDKLIVLKLAHFEESFMVLTGGHALAIVFFLLEFVYKKMETLGIVQTVTDSLLFLIGLLKPPKLQKKMV